MPTPVEVPKLGNTVEECLIARWAKHKGDTVAAGDLVCEIETDKATFEVTAPIDGTILEVLFEEGAYVPVFTTIFTIGDAGETSTPPPPSAPATARPLSPRARRFAAEHDIEPPTTPGSGPNGRILESDLHGLEPARPSSNLRDKIDRKSVV